MRREVPLGRDRILALLRELAGELPDGTRHVVVVAGGALMALHGLRESTHDVDAARALGAALRAAAARVAERHDLPVDWLNDTASAFVPHTLDLAACEVLLDTATLRVLGVPLQDLFVMKVHAARARDVADLATLWSARPFTSPGEAAAYYRAAYPHEALDPHLEDFLRALPGAPA